MMATFARVHALKPKDSVVSLRDAVQPVMHPIDLLDVLQERRRQLPEDGRVGAIDIAQIDSFLLRATPDLPIALEPCPQTQPDPV